MAVWFAFFLNWRCGLSFVLRCYLDMVKVFVFSYFFWLVLCLIFITGTTRINIFCLGYLVACFYFMLFGGSVLMQPVRYILRLWDWLIGYTCFVIAMKNLVSVSDHTIKKFRSCTIVQNNSRHAAIFFKIMHYWLMPVFPSFSWVLVPTWTAWWRTAAG